MGKTLLGNMINDSVYNARMMYNDAKLAFSQHMSNQAQITGNTTWRNPNAPSYTYRNAYGDIGPLAEFNDTHKGEKYRFWETDKKMHAYKQEYNNFENEAIKNGYTVYTKDGNELFQFNKNNRNRSQEATIGFDKDLLEIRDKSGNVIDCPHAPEESYNPAYRMYDQKRAMARIANDIFYKNTPNLNGSKNMHVYYKNGLEMMEYGIDPKIEALNKYGLDLDSKFDRSNTSYQSILERKQPFVNNPAYDNAIDGDYRELSSKSDKDIVDMVNDINRYSIGTSEQNRDIPRIENKNVDLPQTRQEIMAEALYWIASAIQNPQATLSKFMDKYGDHIKSISDKQNEDSKSMNEFMNDENSSSFVKGINHEVNDISSGQKKDYKSINAYFEDQNEHIRNYNDFFAKNREIIFKDENNKVVEVGINSLDSSKRMAIINCLDAGKLKMSDKEGNTIDAISDNFTQNKATYSDIASEAERMSYNVTKRNLAEMTNYSDEQKEKFSSNGKNFNAMFEETKSMLPFRKNLVDAYDKGIDPIEVSMKDLQIGKYSPDSKETAISDYSLKETDSETKCKENINKINAALALAANIKSNTTTYEQERKN